jgi:hypothetical protein
MKKHRPLKLSPAAQNEFDETKAKQKAIFALVRKAEYKKAFQLAKKTLKKHPGNRFALYHYAVQTGDSSSYVSKAQHLKNQKAAARILKKLLRRAQGIDPRWVKAWRNEYYYFSKQPYRQYRLGIDHAKKDGKGSLYSAGVGAVIYAHNYYLKGRPAQGVQWAKKSVKAWEGYFTVVPDYYNAYVWYAKALGLTGDLEAMEKALKKAAKLAKKPLSYSEFKETRMDVMEALKKVRG